MHIEERTTNLNLKLGENGKALSRVPAFNSLLDYDKSGYHVDQCSVYSVSRLFNDADSRGQGQTP